MQSIFLAVKLLRLRHVLFINLLFGRASRGGWRRIGIVDVTNHLGGDFYCVVPCHAGVISSCQDCKAEHIVKGLSLPLCCFMHLLQIRVAPSGTSTGVFVFIDGKSFENTTTDAPQCLPAVQLACREPSANHKRRVHNVLCCSSSTEETLPSWK